MLGKLIRKAFSLKEHPWQFSDFTSEDLKPLTSSHSGFLTEATPGFLQCYSSLLDAIANSDSELLSEICDWKIFKSLDVMLNTLAYQKRNAIIMNNDAKVNISYFNDKYLVVLPKFPDYLASFFNTKFENIKYIEGNSASNITQISVMYQSSKKLVLVDENGNPITPNANIESESHLITFQSAETFSQTLSSRMKQILRTTKFLNGDYRLENSEWKITDIDHYIESRS